MTLSALRQSELEAEQLDFLDPDFYVTDPYSAYAWLRANRPVSWDPHNELWALASYDDIVHVERHKELYINSGQVGGYRPKIPADRGLIGLDDPAHSARRNLVARRFTPSAAAAWENEARAIVTARLDAVRTAGGTAEIIEALAAPLPAMMIGKLLGFGPDRWPQLKDWSERTIALGGGPRYFNEDGVNAAVEFAVAALEVAGERRRCPADDLMTVWTKAQIDGHPLDDGTIGADSLLLLDGGAETTRTVIARTILNLIAEPRQWAALRAGADMTVATEEFIRFVTPIHNMCRTATADNDLGGRTIKAGDQVLMMYSSANRDEAHFAEPERFDVARNPNRHIAFGFGTHFCLGAALARMEIRVFFEELVRRVRSMAITPGTPPVEMPNAFVYGLRAAHVDFTFDQ